MNASGLGLTCATFILAVFASRSIPSLRQREWTERPEDLEWQRQIIEVLREEKAEAHHLDAIIEETTRGCVRYRPEEVAAAGASPDLPASFEYARNMGIRIVARLEGSL